MGMSGCGLLVRALVCVFLCGIVFRLYFSGLAHGRMAFFSVGYLYVIVVLLSPTVMQARVTLKCTRPSDSRRSML